MDHLRIAKAGTIGLCGLALLITLWVGLAGLGLTGEGHCRDTQGSLLFDRLTDGAGDSRMLEASGARCRLAGSDGTGDWTRAGGEAFALDGGAVDGGDWLLAARYEWRDGYQMAGSLPGRLLPVLKPLLGLLALLGMGGLVLREW